MSTTHEIPSALPTPSPDAPPVVAPVAPGAWARDFAIVGATSSFLAVFLVSGLVFGAGTLAAVTLAGAASGALVGELVRRAFATPLGRAPWPALVLLLGAAGTLWGAFVGLVGSLALALPVLSDRDGGSLHGFGDVLTLFVAWASLAASAQLAWFGVAYARVRAGRAPVWPLLLGAVGTPILGWVMMLVLAPQFAFLHGLR